MLPRAYRYRTAATADIRIGHRIFSGKGIKFTKFTPASIEFGSMNSIAPTICDTACAERIERTKNATILSVKSRIIKFATELGGKT